MKKIVPILFLLAIHIEAYNQAGTRDLTFGNKGFVRTDFGSADANAKQFRQMLIDTDGSVYIITTINQKETVVSRRDANFRLDSAYGIDGHTLPMPITFGTAILQSDGKILVGGSSRVNKTNDFTLYRFKTNGLPDETFSADGKQTSDFDEGDDAITSLALQKDGKILAAGLTSSKNGSFRSLAIARYNRDGSLDNEFAGDGKLITTFSLQISAALAIGIRDDGKMTVASVSDVSSQLHDVLIARFLPDGQPDQTFAQGGKAVVYLSAAAGSPVLINCITIQNDGKILIGGFSWYNEVGLLLARLNENTTFDQLFSHDGIEINSFAKETAVHAMVQQKDGKIVVSGYTGVDNYTTDFFIGRYKDDGSLDSSFSLDGNDSRNTGDAPQSEMGRSVALLNDGKILMAGQALNGMAVLKYDIDGKLDNSFDLDGILVDETHGVHRGQTYFNASALQADGKIVVAGAIMTLSSGGDYRSRMFAGRFHPDGKIDSSFSDDGKQVIDLAEQAKDVIIQPDGKIIVAGSTALLSADFAIARLNPDGSFDNSFSGDGKLVIDFDNLSDGVNEVCLQADGKILLAGFSGNDYAIARCNNDGTLDNSFSGDGKLVINLGSTNEQAFSVMVQPDGKILLAGNAYGRFEDFSVLRYNIDGTPDLSFGVDGKVKTDLYGGSDYPSSALLQPDGKIIVAGAVYPGIDSLGTDFAVVRYNSNGSLDTAFSGDGKLRFNVQSISEGATSLALQADQKIILAGFTEGRYKYSLSSARNNPGDFAIARLNTNGTLDETFASNGIMVDDISGAEDGIESISIWKNRIYAVGRTTYMGEVGIIAAYLTGQTNLPPFANGWLMKYNSLTSVIMNAWGSSDPEGGPITYWWEKVAGPAQYTMWYQNATTPVIFNLVNGTYTFRLTVTDNKGSTDTADVTFTVKTNLPPIANGWLMKYYSATSVLFNAWGSYDPEGGKITYWWEKVDGPAQYTMWYRNATTPVIFNMVPGTYKFQLTVTDPEGATGKDTVTLTIHTPLTSAASGRDLTADENGINAGQLHIYPNPVKDILNIRWLHTYIGPATLAVTDMSGKQVKVMSVNKTTEDYNNRIELNLLKPGMYFLFISNGTRKLFSVPFMKE